MPYRSLSFACALALALSLAGRGEELKQHSVFYPPRLTERARKNAARYPWAVAIRKRILDDAQPFLRYSDDELWDMMFGSTITRSHMVWSAGYCPACKKPVPMYDWEIDPQARPWKVRCPHCGELFPKNDFYKFYRSGLDEHGIFDPKRADRSLLFNTGHPGASDPLRTFGVDDGEGYVEGEHRWRFIGAYLLYGQWWQQVLGGLGKLAAAYTVTGEPAYAHKAGILLDRVADVFPTFDYSSQGLVYELPRYGGGASGYVSYSIDSAYDVRKLTLAYDQIFDAIRRDPELVRFLARRAAAHKLENPKATFADVQRNIEGRILRDVLNHPEKIRTNYPGREGALIMIKTVLGWPGNRAEVLASINDIVAESTAVDGLTGEKGLTGYAAIAPHFLASFLEHYARVDEGVLAEVLQRNPKFRQTYRFFVDTWCGQHYYPNTGDSGSFATRNTRYAGLSFNRGIASGKMETDPPVSNYSFLWRFYQATGDPVYPQIMRLANGDSVEGLPFDLFAKNPGALEREVDRVVAREGRFPKIGSVNKQEWHLALLRSPRDPAAATVWLDYDSVPTCKIKGHIHYDAMNLGIFAKGLDLLPEFGYPAVQFGSWHTPQARWHLMTAAHNTVVVDGKNQVGGDGRTTLWEDGRQLRIVRASSPEQYRVKQYERTAAMADLGGSDFYVLDIFRVVGGADHAKFTHSNFAELTPEGLRLQSAPDYGNGTLMRNFRVDSHAEPGWSADWKIEDRFHYLPAGSNVHLRYTDLTRDAEAYTCESWTVKNATSTEQYWIPTIMTRRQAREGPLASTFVGVFEPYENRSNLARIRRLPLETPQGATYGDANVAVEVQRADGRKDVWIAADVENPLGLTPSLANDKVLVEKEAGVRFAGDMALIRRDAAGDVETVAACNANSLEAPGLVLRLKRNTGCVEAGVQNGRAAVRSGNPADVQELRVGGKESLR